MSSDTTKSPVRVLQVVTDRDRRGAQVFATDLAPGLERLGCHVTTMALAPGRFGDDLPVDVLGSSRLGWSTLRNLRRTAAQHDVVIAHGSTTLPACAIALLGSRRPFVYRQISDPLFWAGSTLKRLRTALLVRRAAHIVALSPSVADVFARHYRLSSDRLTVIPNAVPADRFRPPESHEQVANRAEFELDPNATVLLSAGALVPEKGVDLAIDAVANNAELTLIVAGDGPERAALERRAEASAPGRVRFVGSVDDLRPLYWAADLLVMPSRGGDSMPAVLIEAGLCALPAVACPVGAIADVVVDGETGIVVPIDDGSALSAAVDQLAADTARAQRLGAAAARHCRDSYTIDATAPAWMATMQHVAPDTVGT